MKFLKYFLVLLLPLILFGCECTGQKVEIKPNETAFLVPMYGANKSDQKKFMSIDYLEQNKVAQKLIIIPSEKVDLGAHTYECLPTMKVITVDRTPVTREWTAEGKTGTSTQNQAISVESVESINFGIGTTITVMIKEEDAAKYLYYYAGAPLPTIVDQNVRGLIASKLADAFGTRTLEDCRKDKMIIFRGVEEDAKKIFKEYGITIVNMGMVDGLSYANKEIQTSIDAVFTSQQKVVKAAQDKLEQDKINEKNVATAQAQLEAAQKWKQAQDAMVAKTTLDIEMKKAEAQVEMAHKWNGVMPASIMPQGTNLLMGLDSPKK